MRKFIHNSRSYLPGRKAKLHSLLVLALSSVPMSAIADVIIDNATIGVYNAGLGDIFQMDGPGGFLYAPDHSEDDPTIMLGGDPAFDFSLVPAFGQDWLNGDYTGGSWSAGSVPVPGSWAVNEETAIVYDFALANATDLDFVFGVDNGIVLWLNGNFLFGATGPGMVDPTEYAISVSDVTPGNHKLQVLRADHGSGNGYSIAVTSSASVPEPGTVFLLLTSLFGLGKFSPFGATRRECQSSVRPAGEVTVRVAWCRTQKLEQMVIP